jgi:hypothetical protein
MRCSPPFAPSNELLVKQGTKKKKFLASLQSKREAYSLLLVLRRVLVKDVLRYLVSTFVLRPAKTIRLWLVGMSVKDEDAVSNSSLPVPKRWVGASVKPKLVEFAADLLCSQFADMCKQKMWFASMACDTFWVHYNQEDEEPLLFFLGQRANLCIPEAKTDSGWGTFDAWSTLRLSQQELMWLNSRTLAEAGLEDGDVVDARYAFLVDFLMRGEVIGEHKEAEKCVC